MGGHTAKCAQPHENQQENDQELGIKIENENMPAKIISAFYHDFWKDGFFKVPFMPFNIAVVDDDD